MNTDVLKRVVVRQTAIYSAGSAAGFVISTASVAVLARLLQPEDFGLYAMVTAWTAVIPFLQGLGLTPAIVREDALTQDDLTATFWFRVAAAAVTATLVLPLAPFLGWFYDAPQIVPLTFALGAVYLIDVASSHHIALLEHELRFRPLVTSTVVSELIGAAAGIAAALAGWHYWALVAQWYVRSLSRTLLLWAARPWFPGRPVVTPQARRMLRFGGNLTGVHLLSIIASNADRALLGRFLTPADVGFFSRGKGLLVTPISQIMTPINSVAVATLSKLRNDPERFRAAFLRIVQTALFVLCGVLVVLVPLAPEVVRILLGPGWEPVTPIFLVLAPLFLVAPLNSLSRWLFLIFGRSERMLKVTALTNGVSLVALAIGLHWDALGVATAASLSGLVVQFPVMLAVSTTATPISLRDLSLTSGPFIAAAIFSLFVSSGASRLFVPADGWPTSVALAVIAVLAYLVPVGFLDVPRNFLRSLCRNLSQQMALLLRPWIEVEDTKS